MRRCLVAAVAGLMTLVVVPHLSDATPPAPAHPQAHFTGPSPGRGWLAKVPGVTFTHGGGNPLVRPWANPQGNYGGRAALAAPTGAKLLSQYATATSNTYLLRSGGYMRRVFTAPVNYRNPQGRYQPIDNQLVPTAGGLVNKANSFREVLPSDISQPVVISRGHYKVSMRLIGARSRVAARGVAAVYRGALPGVDAAYRVENQMLRETLTLTSLAAPQHFAFVIRTSGGGLKLRKATGGALALVNARGKVVLSLSPPVAYVQASAGQTHRLPFRIHRVSGGWRLRVNASAPWLRGALAKGPVVIDPDVYAPSQDCYLSQAAPNTSQCSATELDEGSDGTNQNHPILQFDLTSHGMPADTVIASARLGLYLYSETNTSAKSVTASQLGQSWTQSATWNKYDGTNSWTTAGGTVASSSNGAGPPVTSASVGGATGWYYWYPNQIVQGWVSKAQANQGLILQDASGAPNNVLKFYSSKATSNQPHLDLYGWPRAGAGQAYTLDSHKLDDRLSASVNVANGNLLMRSRQVTIPGTNGMDLSLDHYYNSALDGQTWNAFGRAGEGTLFDSYFREYADGTVHVCIPDGQTVVFYPNGSGGYQDAIGIDAYLTKNPDTSFTLTFRRSFLRYDYDVNGSLKDQKDRYGNTITINRNSSEQVQSVTDTQGHTMTVTYNSDPYNPAITDIYDWQTPTARHWHYTYGGAGGAQMTSNTDPNGKTTSYGYASNHLLSSITDPLGNVTLINYDSSNRVSSIVRTTDTNHTTGPTWSFYYSSGGSAAACPAGQNVTIETDPNYSGAAPTFASPPSTTNHINHTTTYCSNNLDQVLSSYDGLGHQRQHSYTPTAYIASYTGGVNAGGSTADNNYMYSHDGYDNATQLDVQSSSTGKYSAKASYDPSRGSTDARTYLPTNTTSPSSDVVTYGYDANGGFSSATDDSSPTHSVSVTRNTNGTVAYSYDGNGNKTTYQYDTNNYHLTSITPATVTAGQQINATSYTYDNLNRVATTTDGLSNVTTYGYDPNDRTTNISFSGGATGTTNTFDADGNLTARADQVGTESFTLNALNQVTNQTLNGRSSDYTYDTAGNLQTLADAGGTVTYAYDGANQLCWLEVGTTSPSSCTGPSDGVSFAYDANGQRTQAVYPNGMTVSTTYEYAGRPKEILATKGTSTLEDLKYTYLQSGGTPAELADTRTDATNGNVTTYSYSNPGSTGALDRLVEAKTMNGTSTISDYKYAYDGAGNITSRTNTGGTTTYAYNQDNELCWSYAGTSSNGCGTAPSGASTYSYDTNGQVLSGPNGLGLSYNPRNQTSNLAGYLGPDQNLINNYGDTIWQENLLGINRKRLSDGTSTYYTRDNDGQLIGERLPSGTNGCSGSTCNYYYLTDALGSVVGLVNSSGALANTYSYDPYGRTTPTGTTDNPFTYDGGFTYTYNNGANQLVHFGARWYDPTEGRWTQTDPLNMPMDLAQADRYSFVGADPVNETDPSGTCFVFCKTWHKVGSYISRNAKPLGEIALGATVAAAGVAGGAACAYFTEGIESFDCYKGGAAGWATGMTFVSHGASRLRG